ncbi:hypothetical protein FNV43_RR17018 [Rhamnella rubrinervis]|nr:hypothetical protein FNV43_RR17018 [Rhamnella rubrinervis]
MKLQDWTTNILQSYGVITTNNIKHEVENAETEQAGTVSEIENQDKNVIAGMKINKREVEVVEPTQA